MNDFCFSLAAFAVGAGEQHTCALLVSGSAACWGWGAVGQLGIGSTQNVYTPTLVLGLTPTQGSWNGEQHCLCRK